ncbi:MAG TPA: sigma 54-interacting transcriptional regulator [Candidatus Avanaerovorax faecigallinarum]|nr:sigma 54-interacting transcriptional regulator [Candidatus Avanaerovorax faecigallinarum]
MRKKLAVVATEKDYADFLKGNIEKYLGKYADFFSYSVDEMNRKGVLDEDYVLISAFNIFQDARKMISPGSEIIVLSFALNKKQMERINMVPKGTRALLVNFDNRSCMHTITSLYDAGYRDVELIPYCGEEEYDHSIKLAITPNEAHLVPNGIETVINVGESSVSMNSLYEIADKLGVYEEFSSGEAAEARKEYYYINSGLDRLFAEKISVTDKLSTLIRLMKEGIVITDVFGKIYLSNEKADLILKRDMANLNGVYIEELLPGIILDTKKEKIIKTGDRNVIAEAVDIISQNRIAGYIVTLTDFEEMEEKQHGIRAKIAGSSHVAKYTFDDVIGHSDAIIRAVNEARRFAGSDSSVLITGESGTGKEMFAQSIHNASSRSRYNFVAVNCAAIPENLLESEMFGYEEGSFTGARKGGKTGLFELAHRGTIFLDEIGEMPLQLQSKLLRVLEERKVRRIGSDKNIDIDVRVIAATNKNIHQLMLDGSFREDLYYRLNVLPLAVPSLRERKDDIEELFYHLAKDMHSDIKLRSDAVDLIMTHSWPGNVRELRNVTEYLTNQNKVEIGAEDFKWVESARDAEEKRIESKRTAGDAGDKEKFQFMLTEGNNIEYVFFLLETMKKLADKKERYGRKRLEELLTEGGVICSEGEIRSMLVKLTHGGYVRTLKGRGGSEITRKGIELLDFIREFRETGLLG